MPIIHLNNQLHVINLKIYIILKNQQIQIIKNHLKNQRS